MCCYVCFFFFQAEDGIRDSSVTGVQTCALPISRVVTFDPHVCTSLGRTRDQIVGALQRRAVAPISILYSDCKRRFTGRPRHGLSSEHPYRGVPAVAVLEIAGDRNGIFAASAQPLLPQIGAPSIPAAHSDLYKARPTPDRGGRIGLRDGPEIGSLRDRRQCCNQTPRPRPISSTGSSTPSAASPSPAPTPPPP